MVLSAADRTIRVWLGFFLYEMLMQFAVVARTRRDLSFVECWQRGAALLGQNPEQNGWDGGWYRSAYLDDGLRTAYNYH